MKTKKAIGLSMNMIVGAVLVLIVVGVLGITIRNYVYKPGKDILPTIQAPCDITHKTPVETETILFDYFEKDLGTKEQAQILCQSYQICFVGQDNKYKEECGVII